MGEEESVPVPDISLSGVPSDVTCLFFSVFSATLVPGCAFVAFIEMLVDLRCNFCSNRILVSRKASSASRFWSCSRRRGIRSTMVDASSLSGMQGRLFLECCMVDERACG